MVATKMSKKGSTSAATASELAASVSKMKESSVKPSTPKANESASTKTNVPVTLKQSRSIPKVKSQQNNK
jgi:hypothetical protein